MTPINDIKIADQKLKKLAATAAQATIFTRQENPLRLLLWMQQTSRLMRRGSDNSVMFA